MSIFDKTINDFLKTQEPNHICNLCDNAMAFNKKHGYYECNTCTLKGDEKVIKLPQYLIGVGNKPIALFWANCSDCGKNNVCDLSQEPFVIVKGEVKQNFEQENITCTHCKKSFKKGAK